MIALALVLGCGEPPPTAPTPVGATAREVVRSTWVDVSREHERGWVGLRGEVQGGTADCIADWRMLALDGDGEPVRSVSGEAFVPAGATVTVTGLVSEEPERSAAVTGGEVEVIGARCGADLPEPHAGLVHAEPVGVGALDELPYAEVALRTEDWGPPRCAFTLVLQGLGDHGLPVRHDERRVSLRPDAERTVRVPLTELHSGHEEDTAPLVASSRAWVEDFACLPTSLPDPEPALDAAVATWSATDAVLPFEVAVWPTLDLRSPLDTDCTFVVEVTAVDWSGRALGAAAWTIRLGAGEDRRLTPATPLGLWEDLVEDIAILRVTRAERHLGRCDAEGGEAP